MREKLIELLRKVQYQGNAVHGYHDKYIQNGELADHLIANGVVIAENATTTDKDTNVPSKPIPHKVENEPIRVGAGLWRRGTTVYRCPKCQTFVMRYCKFCFECGQALEWPDPPKGE